MARVAERANWLKLLDEAAAALPPMPADTWYGGLLLIRHAHLRPIVPEGSLTRWFKWWLWEVRKKRLAIEADYVVRIVQSTTVALKRPMVAIITCSVKLLAGAELSVAILAPRKPGSQEL